MIKVLVIDDSALMRKLIGGALGNDSEFDVHMARHAAEGLELLHVVKPHVVTLDFHMPGMDGLACLDRIMIDRPTPVVMVSALTREGAETTLEALRLGAVDFVAKPSGPPSLHFAEYSHRLIEVVRGAAAARMRPSLRLKERIQRRVQDAARVASPGPALNRVAVSGSGAALVLVGTSTGGPPALEALLAPLPAGFPWPVVIAQHMPATFTGPLARRLDTLCQIEVVEVVEPMRLKPGRAYIGRGDGDIVVCHRGGDLLASPAAVEAGYPWRPSVDRLVRSAMETIPASQLIGVLMTGMGNDGARALARLHACGGRVIAEAEETAIVWGMPGELVKANGADWVLPLRMISPHLQQMASNAAHSKES